MQTPTLNRQAEFHEETDSFNLAVIFKGDRLSITLKDFLDWAIYSREYTDEDIGEDIHKKMDLSDVFTAFAQTKPDYASENSKER